MAEFPSFHLYLFHFPVLKCSFSLLPAADPSQAALDGTHDSREAHHSQVSPSDQQCQGIGPNCVLLQSNEPYANKGVTHCRKTLIRVQTQKCNLANSRSNYYIFTK